MSIPRGHIKCPAKGCRDGLFRVDLADGPDEAYQHGWLQCRACNGLGYIPDPTLRRVVGAHGALTILDDGATVATDYGRWVNTLEGPVPGTLAHREAEK